MAPNKKRSAKIFGDADDVSPPRKTRRNGPARTSIIDIEPLDINVNAIVHNRVHYSELLIGGSVLLLHKNEYHKGGNN